MSQPYLSQITTFAFGLIPKGWLPCNGQLLQINQNQALFSLLGTTFGGDGRTTFALPNLQGRVPIGTGNGFTIGQLGGEVAHTLTQQELPMHNHPVAASNSAASLVNSPSSSYPAMPAGNLYASSPDTSLAPSSPSGGDQPHNNMQPYLVVQYCIATQGTFPPRN